MNNQGGECSFINVYSAWIKSLADILKKFNPNLFGFSTGQCSDDVWDVSLRFKQISRKYPKLRVNRRHRIHICIYLVSLWTSSKSWAMVKITILVTNPFPDCLYKLVRKELRILSLQTYCEYWDLLMQRDEQLSTISADNKNLLST